MIVVTGAAGFIGGRLAKAFPSVLGVDDLAKAPPSQNVQWIAIDAFMDWLDGNYSIVLPTRMVEAIVHMGACADTTCEDWSYLSHYNVECSCKIWDWCSRNGVPLVYASSCATYGDGSKGFSDDHDKLMSLKPLNMYGWSKHLFDMYAVSSKLAPPAWAGLKLSNVYGPGEESKGKMASMVHQAIRQAITTGKVRLFNFGEQTRDFVAVQDVISVVKFLLGAKPHGVYNVGCGTSESFNRLVELVFETLGTRRTTEYFEMPHDLANVYQGHTSVNMSKLRALGYAGESTSLEMGVKSLAGLMLGSEPTQNP